MRWLFERDLSREHVRLLALPFLAILINSLARRLTLPGFLLVPMVVLFPLWLRAELLTKWDGDWASGDNADERAAAIARHAAQRAFWVTVSLLVLWGFFPLDIVLCGVRNAILLVLGVGMSTYVATELWLGRNV